MLWLLLSSLAFADLPERPEPPKSIAGQCSKNFALTKGRPLPAELSADVSFTRCSAVAVPLSDYADLLATEKWGLATYKIASIEIASIEMERDWYKNRLEGELKPKPWLDRPSTQRWLGRIETMVVVGIVTAGLGTTYYYSSGASR